jgi:hypothetical protein
LKEDSSFSEEKEAKRLLCPGLADRFGPLPPHSVQPRNKGFLLLFFKKEGLASLSAFARK